MLWHVEPFDIHCVMDPESIDMAITTQLDGDGYGTGDGSGYSTHEDLQ